MNTMAVCDRLFWSSQRLNPGNQDTSGDAAEHQQPDKSQPAFWTTPLRFCLQTVLPEHDPIVICGMSQSSALTHLVIERSIALSLNPNDAPRPHQIPCHCHDRHHRSPNLIQWSSNPHDRLRRSNRDRRYMPLEQVRWCSPRDRSR